MTLLCFVAGARFCGLVLEQPSNPSSQDNEQRAGGARPARGLEDFARRQQDSLGFGAERGQEVPLAVLKLAPGFEEGQYPSPSSFLPGIWGGKERKNQTYEVSQVDVKYLKDDSGSKLHYHTAPSTCE